jgi:iron complex transport system substrate-binding protein
MDLMGSTKFKILLAILVFGFVLNLPAWAVQARTVEDTYGRNVELPDKVRSVVVLSRDVLEILRAMDAVNLVAGVSDTVQRDPQFWPELKGAPYIGRWSEPDYEAVALLKPDLVLAYGRYPGPEAEKKLGAAGIALLRLEVYMLSGFDREVRTLGLVLGKQDQAEALLAWRREKFAALDRCLESDPGRPLVYLEGYQKLQTWGPGTGGNETVARGGGANMAEGMHSQYGEITPEWVVTARPEAIIKVSPSKERYVADTPEDLRRSAQEIAQRPGWEVLEAVKSGRIYVLGSEIQGGPRAPIGAAYVARWLHPQACRDIDPEAWHREYIERFQKMPYRGSYVWPPAGQAR